MVPGDKKKMGKIIRCSIFAYERESGISKPSQGPVAQQENRPVTRNVSLFAGADPWDLLPQPSVPPLTKHASV